MINRLCIIGVGLIGGSLARALRAADFCKEIVGAGRSAQHLQTAVDLGVIDRFTTDLGRAVEGADMVLLAVPMGAMEAVLRSIRPHLADDAVLTDAGSSKQSVIDAATRAFEGTVPANLVPGHPIAGTEQSGVEASFAELYRQRRVILTPTEVSDPRAVDAVRAMWEAAGATVCEMEAQHHDLVLAATSHLPHMLAFAVVDTLAQMHEHDEIFQYAAGGFRDFSRIASGDPVMWRDIAIHNRDALLTMLEGYQDDLSRLTAHVRDGDGDALLQLFERAKAARDAHYEA